MGERQAIKAKRRIIIKPDRVHPQLYPKQYDHPRLWNRVDWPARWIAFDAWEKRTKLYQLEAARLFPKEHK